MDAETRKLMRAIRSVGGGLPLDVYLDGLRHMTQIQLGVLGVAVKREAEALHLWTTKDGRKIPIREMGDKHLYNTIRMVHRKGASMRSLPYRALLHEFQKRGYEPYVAIPQFDDANAEWEAANL